MRRAPAQKRKIAPDPVFRSVLVSQVINKVLLKGKKDVARSIVYDALELVERRSNQDPVNVLKRAVDNIRPQVEVRSRSRWWVFVSGPGRGIPTEIEHPGHSLVGELRPPPQGADDVRPARKRDSRCLQQLGGSDQAQRRRPQDGGVEPSLRPLPLVS